MNFTRRYGGTEARRGDIDREQHAEQLRDRVDLIENRVAKMYISDRAKASHLDRAAAIEGRVEARLLLEKACQRLAIGAVEVRYLAAEIPDPEHSHSGFGA